MPSGNDNDWLGHALRRAYFTDPPEDLVDRVMANIPARNTQRSRFALPSGALMAAMTAMFFLGVLTYDLFYTNGSGSLASPYYVGSTNYMLERLGS